MNSIDQYFENIQSIFARVLHEQRENIEKAAVSFAEAIVRKNSIYVFGCSHGAILAEELFYRAGGLAVFNPIFNPALMLNVRPVTLTSQFERLYGQSKAILDAYNIKKGDVMLIHSVSGRNAGVVEMAIEAKQKEMLVIGLTNIEYSKNSSSRHSCGKRLFELVDICIDNCGEFGDGSIKLEGLNEKAGATSTAVGATILNSVSVRTSEILLEKGILPPVLHSANADGGDQINAKIFQEYKDCIHYL